METVARLNTSPYPPRKMRLLADLVRGMRADKALYVLEMNEKKAKAVSISKLLRSAVANWQHKYGDTQADIGDLYVKAISVDKGRMLKRILPAPQGRAHRIRKRYSHVMLVLAHVDSGSDTSVKNQIN